MARCALASALAFFPRKKQADSAVDDDFLGLILHRGHIGFPLNPKWSLGVALEQGSNIL